ncbi:MAG: 1-deoxy-D-xylulose-5-phosphate reductoisomerase, partial [Alphaproteobacteria bacterium]|nr:1-deoxy-D-xylulose-5-phosphate reductoisomerase [Alphaproteobacteria bacterium]
KSVSIWGSTGTIGVKALDIALKSGFDIVSISGNTNYAKLIEQARICRPRYVCVSDERAFRIVKDALSAQAIDVCPQSETENIAKLDIDCCVMAIAGSAGLPPSFSCLGHAKRLAIATKEVIISGGTFFMSLAAKKGTEIIPIDSEHNAIFQCLVGEDRCSVSELILTASGGAFLDLEENELVHVSVEDAMKHPNWNMGRKITVDSATLINKALEIIEASYLFGVDIERIRPLIHPNSIIHGLVRFADNSFKAVLSYPDMSLPISYALNYPERVPVALPSLDFAEIATLRVQKPKEWQKRNIDLAYRAFQEQKVIALSLADEIAVAKFLDGSLKFSEIYGFISTILEKAPRENIVSIEDVSETMSQVKKISAKCGLSL